MATRKAERPYPRGLCPSSAPYRPSMNSSQQRYVGAEEGIREIVIVHRSERICHSPAFFSLTCHHCDVHLQSALDDAFLLERFHLLVDSSLHRHHLLYISSPPPVATPQRGHLRVVPLLLWLPVALLKDTPRRILLHVAEDFFGEERRHGRHQTRQRLQDLEKHCLRGTATGTVRSICVEPVLDDVEVCRGEVADGEAGQQAVAVWETWGAAYTSVNAKRS